MLQSSMAMINNDNGNTRRSGGGRTATLSLRRYARNKEYEHIRNEQQQEHDHCRRLFDQMATATTGAPFLTQLHSDKIQACYYNTLLRDGRR
mmetsp:Transcript_27687/g.51966  ORF Transcript_27687/g.51966 Transcript_27687/m.51966 type:complete len:92 (-) Transcript_27687:2859-3134(-)